MALSERQEQLERREAILQAVGRAARQLLQATGPGTVAAVHRALAELGPAAGAGRAYIFVNTTAADGSLSASEQYSWSAPGTPPLQPRPSVQKLGYKARGFERWLSLLPRGEPIHGPVGELPDGERDVFEEAGVRSLAIVPVFVEEEWWGFVGFSDYDEPRVWLESELDALRVAAGVISAAFQRRRAENRLRRRNRELALLNRVVAAATSNLEPVAVLDVMCRELARAFNIPQAGVALLNREGTSLEVVAQYSELAGPSAVGGEIPLAENEASRFVLARQEPLVIADVRRDPRMVAVRELMAEQQVSSILILPLLVDGEAVGTIGLDAITPRDFSGDDVNLAMNVAAAATQVLSKARLLSAEQRNAARISGILRLSTELATLRDEDILLRHLVTGLAGVAGSATCTIFFAEEAPSGKVEEAVLAAQVGLPAGTEGLRIPLTHPAVKELVGRQEPLVVSDIDAQFPMLRTLLVRDDVRAFYVFPLSSEGRTLGFITLSYRHPHDPTVTEINAYRLLAERAAAALHTVRLLREIRQQAGHLGALHQLGLAISSSLEPEKVYQAIVEHSAALIGTEIVNLFLLESQQEEYVGLASHGPGEDSVRGQRFPLHDSKLVPALMERSGALAIDDVTAGEMVAQMGRRRSDIGAALAVPLRYRERLVGFLVCIHPGGPRRWQPAELALAESLAAQAAIAVANARLHAATRRLLSHTRAQARTVQQIVDTIPEGLLLLDKRRRVLLANPLAREYLPLLADFGPENTLQRLGDRSLETLLAPPPAGRLAHELVVNRPRRRIFELSAHNLATGPQAGNWMLILHEATAEREQQAYLHAQDRLATVGQLAAGIAHDFNNIMAVISLYSQTLLQQDYPEPDRERFSVIYEQAGQASHLIAQILDFSRRSVVERRPLNLVPFLKELVKLLERTLPETIAIELDFKRADLAVRADPTRLQQAIMNLALNARDAMPNGGLLHFSLVRHDRNWRPPLPDMDPAEWICLTVADSGKGIRHEHRPHIFEPFFTTKEPGEGTGLGLAQVYGIVKQHDGFIDLSSEVGVGTIVSIFLPALALPQPATAPLPPEKPAPAGGETLLLVEDDGAMRDALAHTLEDLNYRVLVAANGEEALALCEAQAGEIDLVLSDLVMPRMGGQALYRELRARHPGLPLILFSGYPLGDATKTFVEESGLRWLQKPFSSRTVHQAIQAALAP